MRDIGKNIRTARIRSDIKQEELAEKLYVTRQTVSNYENGKSRPDIDMLISISEVLGVDLSELLYGVKTPPQVKRKKVWLLVWTIVLAVLSAITVLLMPSFKELAITRYIMLPLFLLRFAVVPLIFLLLGWIVMQSLHIFSGLKKPAFAFGKPIFIILLTITLALFFVLFFCMPLAYATRIKIFAKGMHLALFLANHPYKFSALSGALWLTKKDKLS